MIPKIIHYCWLSDDPIPVSLQKCMESWKKYLPDYEFIHWNFDRFNKDSSLWVKQAFENKKYAFAADYIRLYALYHYGGIYLDMDVEVLKSFDALLSMDTMICFENSKDQRLEVAAFGVEKNSEWVHTCLSYYHNKSFIKEDGSFDTKVLPIIIRNCLVQNGFILESVKRIDEAMMCGSHKIPVFPYYYFSPKSYATGKIECKEDTYCIHHFAGSWQPWFITVENKFWNRLGLFNPHILLRLYNLFKYGTLRQYVK